MDAPTLRLGFAEGWALIFVVAATIQALLVAFGWYPREESYDFVLTVIRWIHIAANVFVVFYPFVFDRDCDALFLGTFAVVAVSWWALKNECVLTYWEKKVLDPTYVMGSRPSVHVYAQRLFVGADGLEHPASLILPIGMHVSLLYVMARYAWASRDRVLLRWIALPAVSAYVAFTLTCILETYMRGHVTRQFKATARGNAR